MIALDGWTLDTAFRAWKAHGGHGCTIHFAEPGSVPVKRYTRAMHPDDMRERGFPCDRAEHDPTECLQVAESTKGPVYMTYLTDGYLHVGATGRYAQAAIDADLGVR